RGGLDDFKIRPDSVCVGNRTPKGYYRHQFDEAWQRYLAAQGVNETQQRNNFTAAGTSRPFQNATEESVLRSENSEKSNNDGHCCGVAVRNGGNGLAREDDGDPAPAENENSISDDDQFIPEWLRRAPTCAQCNAPIDGQGQQSGDVWLHPECVRFWKGRP